MTRIPSSVFGVPIDGLALDEVFGYIASASQPVWIVTANPEILLEARRDHEYANALRQADIRTVDGFGLYLLLHWFGFQTTRLTGVDLAERLIEWAVKNEKRVALIGGMEPKISKEAMEQWKKKYPTLNIVAEWGGQISRDGQDDERGEEARNRLTLFAPDVLLVAFGHPKQERWIARYLSGFPTVRTVVGVGGTFEVWAGRLSRAPRFLQMIGLEWLWRLLLEPKRWKRIFDAVLKFPVLFFLERIKHSEAING